LWFLLSGGGYLCVTRREWIHHRGQWEFWFFF
jgi:hypothetical protein